ncbi:MAG TPA: lipopolysaccharide biosynthesis protein, partial [Alphaproteobacteria bacterium]|nr:lipopolysaccharide biosynthesis protein [Alphaproteobacteria bacterium]
MCRRSGDICGREASVERRKYGLRARLSAVKHLLHAIVRAAGGRSFAKRVRLAGARFDDPAGDEFRGAWLDAGVAGEIRKFTAPGPEFEEFDPSIAAQHPPRAKLLAYYLPQFHEIPENNEWWGKGFTEWTNVARAAPRFAGHYQPRIPRDLGFYSLDDAAVLRRQAKLAKAAGIHGFCFYYYWFGRRRLLEKPLDLLLANPDIDIDFCLLWANEPWTRRWDGAEDRVLMPQDYGEHTDEAFVDELARHFRDRRYIRIDGRPLLVVYRFRSIPGGGERAARWRALFRERHGEEPLVFMAQTGDDDDPRAYGLDGAIEFPPRRLAGDTAIPEDRLRLLDRDFHGRVHSYDAVARRYVANRPTDFPLIKSVLPSWDNDARLPGGGFVI